MTELVVLADETGAAIGTADKATVHTFDTPLHLAVSCYAVDDRGRVLVTRRALGKRTWPGVWTNTCCGHPGPGEAAEDAVVRRMRDELALEVDWLRPLLPDFRYRAVAADGIVENEICPVFLAGVSSDPTPDPDEVADWVWVESGTLVEVAARSPWLISPWAALQLAEIAAQRKHLAP